MESAQNTNRLKPASPYSSDPRERFEALRMEGDCKGHSPATRAVMAWLITANIPRIRLDQLSMWPDQPLWEAAKKAYALNPATLRTVSDQILQSLAWGEAVALLWGLRKQTPTLPTGSDVFSIINAASPGFGSAIQGLAYEDDLPPFNELRWKFQSFVEAPFKPSFKNWLCLLWWPDQALEATPAMMQEFLADAAA